MIEKATENRNEYELLIKLLLGKYGGDKKAGSLTEIYSENQEYAGKIKAMGRKSKALFGTTFAQYLKQIGVIGKNKKDDNPESEPFDESIKAEKDRAVAEAENAAEIEKESAAEEAEQAAEAENAVEAEKDRVAEKAEQAAIAEDERKAEEEFRLKAEAERKAAEEELRLKAEAENQAEEEKNLEDERKLLEEKQKRYEEDYSAWKRHCKKREAEREQEFIRRLNDKRSELEIEAEIKRDDAIKAATERMIQYQKQLLSAEMVLDSLGFFSFKEKKVQRESIAQAEAGISSVKRDIDTAKDEYNNEMLELDSKVRSFEAQIRMSVEKDIPMPDEPEKQ